MEHIQVQLSSFIVLLFTGMVLGGFFDLYRVFRSRIKIRKFTNLIGDFCFWLLATLIIIPLIYWGTWLEIRLYVWIAILIGLISYFIFFSAICISLFKMLWKLIGWLPGMILNLIWRCQILFRRIKQHKK